MQHAIVLGDHAMATLRASGDDAPEAATVQLHECADLIAATREGLSAWRAERFVADLGDHIHPALLGR